MVQLKQWKRGRTALRELRVRGVPEWLAVRVPRFTMWEGKRRAPPASPIPIALRATSLGSSQLPLPPSTAGRGKHVVVP